MRYVRRKTKAVRNLKRKMKRRRRRVANHKANGGTYGKKR